MLRPRACDAIRGGAVDTAGCCERQGGRNMRAVKKRQEQGTKDVTY